jgi:diguanylate cyclase (GGDEF)-like protein/PAS domain S-box-containing protein
MNDKLLEVLETLNYPTIVVDSDNTPLWANRKFLRMQGISIDRLEKTELRHKIREVLTDGLSSGELNFEKKGRQHYFQPIRSSLKTEEKNLAVITLFDISKRKQFQAELLARQEMFEKLSEYLPEGIVLCHDTIVYSNPAFENLIGYSGSELRCKTLEELISPPQQPAMHKEFQQLFLRQKSKLVSTLQLTAKNGESIWVRIKSSLLLQGEKKLFLTIITDITEERSEMQRLNKLANIDPLTAIYNRRKFNELLLIEYKRAKRYSRHLSALFLDIDHFKKINDVYGHDIGDAVLKEFARLVQSHMRETDVFARWGGEEFVVLLPETTAENAVRFAEHIRTKVEAYSFAKAGTVTVSIGITPLHKKEQADAFLKRLDQALYKAKKEGRNRSVLL